MSTVEAEIEALRAATEFTTCVSIRYHARRRAFFDVLHRTGKIATGITGASAFAVVFGGWPGVTKWVALMFGAYGFIDLVVGFSERARKHDELYRRFTNLAAEIVRAGRPISLEIENDLKAKRLLIEADEPTALEVLNVLCHNAEAEAKGRDESLRHVYPHARIFAHLLSLQWRFLTVAEHQRQKELALKRYNDDRIR